MNYINFSAFELPPIKDAAGNVLSPFGNAPRNPGRTPAFYESDLDLNKRFNSAGRRLKMEFRTEVYNLFNHTNLYLPGTISGSQGTTPQPARWRPCQLSTITGSPTGGGQISSTFEPRILQFGLKILY